MFQSTMGGLAANAVWGGSFGCAASHLIRYSGRGRVSPQADTRCPAAEHTASETIDHSTVFSPLWATVLRRRRSSYEEPARQVPGLQHHRSRRRRHALLLEDLLRDRGLRGLQEARGDGSPGLDELEAPSATRWRH